MYDLSVSINPRHEPPSLSRSGAPPVKHVWVSNPPGEPAGRYPGLIVEWRNGAGSWQARVVYIVPSTTSDVVTERWLLAERLTPIPATTP